MCKNYQTIQVVIVCQENKRKITQPDGIEPNQPSNNLTACHGMLKKALTGQPLQ